MKRKSLASIFGLAAIAVASSSYGQGKINLNNYSASGNQIVYGGGPNAISGTTVGYGLWNGGSVFNGVAGNVTWTIGFYYALGDVTANVNSDPSGFGIPSGGGLTFATDVPGDTTTVRFLPGYFATPTGDAIINGWTAGSVTFEVVAYSGVDYESSPYRGHSAAFLLTPIAASAPQAAPVIGPSKSAGMPQFSVFSVPEPSTFALAGLGAAAVLAFRRKEDF